MYTLGLNYMRDLRMTALDVAYMYGTELYDI